MARPHTEAYTSLESVILQRENRGRLKMNLILEIYKELGQIYRETHRKDSKKGNTGRKTKTLKQQLRIKH